MNQIKHELAFEGNFSYLQHNFILFLVSRSAFIPNSLGNLSISAHTKFITIEPPCLIIFFNMIAQIVVFTFIRRLLIIFITPRSDANTQKLSNLLRLYTKPFRRGISKSISKPNGCYDRSKDQH